MFFSLTKRPSNLGPRWNAKAHIHFNLFLFPLFFSFLKIFHPLRQKKPKKLSFLSMEAGTALLRGFLPSDPRRLRLRLRLLRRRPSPASPRSARASSSPPVEALTRRFACAQDPFDSRSLFTCLVCSFFRAQGQYRGPQPKRDLIADWVPNNDGLVRSLPIYVGGASLLAVLFNRTVSGIPPVADASSSQSRADLLTLGLAVTNILAGLVWLSIRPKSVPAVSYLIFHSVSCLASFRQLIQIVV